MSSFGDLGRFLDFFFEDFFFRCFTRQCGLFQKTDPNTQCWTSHLAHKSGQKTIFSMNTERFINFYKSTGPEHSKYVKLTLGRRSSNFRIASESEITIALKY
jgi:hypothetical protein